MEPLLNFVWALVAISSVCLWFRLGRREGAEQRRSLIAVVVLIVILFPVISVSDDLWSAQNPAETDTCLRRDHQSCCSHLLTAEIAFFPRVANVEPGFSFQDYLVWHSSSPRVIEKPELDGIESRPPPSV
jgi:hypothetical protein